MDSVACRHMQLCIRMFQLFNQICTLDPWPTFLVKDYINILIQPICSIVNLSLLEGVVIDKFKHAVVTPLIKKPSLDAEGVKNYRLLGFNFISKTIERGVSKQLLTVNELAISTSLLTRLAN